jgi:pSer/pThr/pTyr-binding forkhead associated (FHA) protein
MEVTFIDTDPYVLQEEHVVNDLPMIIGRSADTGVRLGDPTVSRHHCVIEEMEGLLVVRDLGSTNGTYVNGQRVFEALLMPGHHLTMGNTRLLVCYECDVAGSEACTEHEAACQSQEA